MSSQDIAALFVVAGAQMCFRHKGLASPLQSADKQSRSTHDSGVAAVLPEVYCTKMVQDG